MNGNGFFDVIVGTNDKKTNPALRAPIALSACRVGAVRTAIRSALLLLRSRDSQSSLPVTKTKVARYVHEA